MSEYQQTVFIIDDDPDIRALVTAVLEPLAVTMITACDGEEGISRLRELLPDLVILDGMMPGKHGIEVCRELRMLDGGALVPVLMLTSLDSPEDKMAGLRSGADDYLTKPFHAGELQARVAALLRVRALTVSLEEKNREMQKMQDQIVAQERQLAATQALGTTCHELGQPVTALTLQMHLLSQLDPQDPQWQATLQAATKEVLRMRSLLESLQKLDIQELKSYYKNSKIFTV
jgi:DNA-binding response OmpR family regulator